ncbi:hypothetical protein M3Y99_01319400 [Aphelenchoides fujianensis]|nr:hypothetical protein M3Y99_01319400 [Aphelenchoides fujianensis]
MLSSRLTGRIVALRRFHPSGKNGDPLEHFSFFNPPLADARGALKFPGWFLRDNQPGEYPENEAERRAAAMKYGLRPEDYQPIDKDDVRYHAGDYPDLGMITYDNKDPYEAYTDSWNRRNWGEPVQMSFLKHRADRNSYNGLDLEDFTMWKGVLMSLQVLVPFFFFMWWIQGSNPADLRYRNPVMPKQYPFDYQRSFPWEDPRSYPIINYSFEPADE